MFLQFLLYSKVTQSYINAHSFFPHTIFHHVLTGKSKKKKKKKKDKLTPQNPEKELLLETQ